MATVSKSIFISGGRVAKALTNGALSIVLTSSQYAIISFVSSTDTADVLTITADNAMTLTGFSTAGTTYSGGLMVPPAATVSFPANSSSTRIISYSVFESQV